MKFAVENTPSGKTIVAGLTHTSLERIIALPCHVADLGVRAGLLPCPYYFPNSFSMALEFFSVLDWASDLEIVLYDNPVYTKTWLSAEELFIVLDACPRITGVKVTDHDLITALKKSRKAAVFSGDAVVAFRSLLLGVDGSMIIAPSIFPAAYSDRRAPSRGEPAG